MAGNDDRVCIIVPLFHGHNYISGLLKQFRENAKRFRPLSLVLFNDDAENPIPDNVTGSGIKLINAESRRGIHGARVAALAYAEAEFVLFLDQDDHIEDDYVLKQVRAIGDKDAVVCRAHHAGRPFYTNTNRLESVVNSDYILAERNPIISPGQVLIRRSSIPEVWKKNILKHNGADDYFLWISMACAGCEFALNQEVLFEHLVDGLNASSDTNQMMDSELEMINVLLEDRNICTSDKDRIKKLPDKLRRMHIRELTNYKRAFLLMQNWSQLTETNTPGLEQLKSALTVAIYGAGDVGRALGKKLEDNHNLFFIDQNAEFLSSEHNAYTLEDAPADADIVIISLSDKTEEVYSVLKDKYGSRVFYLDDLFKNEKCLKKLL